MRAEAAEHYTKALKAGQKFYRAAVSRGEYPYAPALDDLIRGIPMAGYADLGLMDIPSELIVGTKTAGRVAALAGNFMPLLKPDSEFAVKWQNLCAAHLSDEGIRDAVKCYEYMGRFYVMEGNKRVSVLKSYQAPLIPCDVTRIIPRLSDDHDIQLYYEFMRFHALSGQYGVEFRHRGGWEKLQAALGMAPDHAWTDVERRSFQAGFAQFRKAFDRLGPRTGAVTPAEALLIWLQVYSFGDIKSLTTQELTKKLTALWPDVEAQSDDTAVELNVEPASRTQGLLSRILGSSHVTAAFIYAYATENSPWTLAHDCGVRYLDQHMGDRVETRTYVAEDRDYLAAILKAADEGADVIFATTAPMISACRKAAALRPELRILNCGLFQPYTGVRMYYARIHESKFIAGAVAGAMAENDVIGYIANYPIFGVPASINAFALGARLVNPRARIELRWTCLPGDPVRELAGQGVTVFSNRDAAEPGRSYELGLYRRSPDGRVSPLAVPMLYWGEIYERVCLSILSGAWSDPAGDKAVNYWWGMDSGVVDIRLDEQLPEGVKTLAGLLKQGITDGSVDPFRTRIIDNGGVLRCDGSGSPAPDELVSMNWLCDNVSGSIPGFDELRPESRETVRQLGIYRRQLTPETEEKQL